MTVSTKNINELIKEFYNGTISAVKKIISLDPSIGAPKLITPPLNAEFGVMVGFTGELRGELVLQSDQNFIREIGETMFGMPLPNEMVESFAGELGNMVAGSLSTYLAEQNIKTDITHPTVIKGDVELSGFKRALLVDIRYSIDKKMAVHLLLNQKLD